MKKFMLLIILLIVFIPLYTNAEGYYLNNMKEDQIFNCNDEIILYTPPDLISSDNDTIRNIYGDFTSPYGKSFFFVFLNGTITSQNANGSGYSSSSNNIVFPYDYDYRKDVYWKISKVEYEAFREGFNIYFQAYERMPNLIISNYINDLKKYTAKKDEVLKYSIKIENNGDGKSLDNVIISNIPNGLLVLEDKISDNGRYNKDNNTIEWNLEVLNAEAEYVFNYYAKVITEDLIDYVGNSYITSYQVLEKVESDDTIVNIENVVNDSNLINNPYTGTRIYVIMLIIILIVSLCLCLIIKKSNLILRK